MSTEAALPDAYPHLDEATWQRTTQNLIDGRWELGTDAIPISHKYSQRVLGSVSVASPLQVRRAIEAAQRTMATGSLPGHRRATILHRAADWLRAHAHVIGHVISQESGKEIKEAKREVERSAHTLELSAAASGSVTGELVPMHESPGFENALAFTMRVPIGPICAITPFNSPLGLVAHKVGPALASGNAVVLKPTELAPTPAAYLGQALTAAGLPPGWFQIVQGPGETVGQMLLEDPGFRMYSFTGSRKIGEHIKRSVGLRRVALELGNNSATIVHEDADIPAAATLCARQAFSNSGQVCISVQRIYVHDSVKAAFIDRLEEATKALSVGDPEDESTDVGPMISNQVAARAMEMIDDAVTRGGQLLLGGTRLNNVLEPTILLDPPDNSRVICEEAFAPIAAVSGYTQLDDVFRRVNDGDFGLQCGIFTNDIETAFRAVRALDMGGVIINGVSRYRADVMPYGGVKGSGEGREGPKSAVLEMTESRLVVFNLASSPYRP